MKTGKQGFLLAGGIGLLTLLLIGLTIVSPALAQGPGGMMGGYGYGGYGSGMMDGYGSPDNGGYGYNDMMNGYGGYGMMGGFGGMMGSYFGGGLFAPGPLTLPEATEALETWLAALGDDNLTPGEVMIFDNHAYAQIVDTETGIGAMEVLIDPVTRSISPEIGPNMMWNLKYGMMSGYGGYGMMGMMGGYGYAYPGAETPTLPTEMPLSPEEAVNVAQAYLDAYVPGNLQADDQADPFPGYYTLHVLRDGQPVGMLSVNGYTQQVFLHTWHGDFIEMSGE